MLLSRLLIVAALAQSASCSPVSPDSLSLHLSSPVVLPSAFFSALNNTDHSASLDLLGSEDGQTTLDKRVDNHAGKRGIPWQLRDGGSLAPFDGLASYYTYSPYGHNVTENGPGFIPQLWGCSDAHVDEFKARMSVEWTIVGSDQKARLTKRKELFTFNEPNEANQANCTPALAAAVWKKTIEPLREQGWRVGAPAVSTGGWGMSWMLDWWRECNGSCHPDFLALHFYNPTASALPSTLTQWRTSFNLPVQVTEIAPMSWPPRDGEHIGSEQVRNYMQSVMAWMDGTEWDERYYWYGARWDMGKLNPELALLKDSKTLSELRQLYLSSQSPQYAWNHEEGESGEVKLGFSSGLLAFAPRCAGVGIDVVSGETFWVQDCV